MVIDHFQPLTPDIDVAPPWFPSVTITGTETWDWQQFFEDYKKAAEAARTVDTLTGQPDCVDPEKHKLEARIAELERLLAANEFVIVSGGGLEPGTYRVVEGKLYKAL